MWEPPRHEGVNMDTNKYSQHFLNWFYANHNFPFLKEKEVWPLIMKYEVEFRRAFPEATRQDFWQIEEAYWSVAMPTPPRLTIFYNWLRDHNRPNKSFNKWSRDMSNRYRALIVDAMTVIAKRLPQ